MIKEKPKDLPAEEVIVPSPFIENVYVIPSGKEMRGAEEELSRLLDSQRILAKRIQEIEKNFDLENCVIDAPPVIQFINRSCMFAADSIIIPITPAHFSLEGTSDLLEDIALIAESRDQPVGYKFLICIADNRTTIAREVEENLKEMFGDSVATAVIPQNIDVSQAHAHNQSVLTYSPRSKGALAYADFIKEIISNE